MNEVFLKTIAYQITRLRDMKKYLYRHIMLTRIALDLGYILDTLHCKFANTLTVLPYIVQRACLHTVALNT